MNCDFCFGSICKNNGLKFSELIYLLEKFKAQGVQYLVISGGEPLTYKYIYDFIYYAKSLGFVIVLSTNGLLVNDISKLNNIDVLSIPIDGENYKYLKRMRNITYTDYQKVLYLIKEFKRIFPNKILKIGTVVSKRNYKYIENIYYQIQNYADVWKIYQVSKHYNNENIYYSNLKISDETFNIVKEKLIRKTKCDNKNSIRIETYENKTRDGKYLFCEPNGDAMVITNNCEKIIGNFIDDFDNVVKEWNKYVDNQSVKKNFETTYLMVHKYE